MRTTQASCRAGQGRVISGQKLVLLGLLSCLGPGGLAAQSPWSLQQAIGFALSNSPNVRVAEHRLDAAQAALRQANAAFWPHLQFQSSYFRSDNPVTVFGATLNQRRFQLQPDNPQLFNDPSTVDNLNLRGQVILPLYAGGRNRAGRQAAQANAAASVHATAAARDQIAFEVARTFFTILKGREFIRSSEAAVAAFERNLALATNRFKVGTILRAEVLDVEVQLAQAREDLIRARNSLALAERALRNLLGIEQGQVLTEDSAPAIPVPEEMNYDLRPELLAAQKRVETASALVRQAGAGYLPRLNGFGQYEYDKGWETGGSGRSWTAGAMLEWDLWDGQLTRGRVSQARAQKQAAEEEERQVRLAIDLEVAQARLNVQEARERLEVTTKSVDLALESAELTRSRFEQGLALSTQLIDAETALTTARVRRAQAEADLRIAVAALRRALGLPQLPARGTEG